MAYLLLTLCALLSAVSALLAWKILLMRRSAEEIRRGLQERLETDTNTLLSISSQDRAMRRLAAGLNSQLRLLRQERCRYRQGDQALKDAVANISHDLRTPLTSISGNAGILIDNGSVLDEQKKMRLYIDIYEDSIWLIQLVENLLSVTRIENGSMDLHMEAELIEEIIQEALRYLERRSLEHPVHVQLSDDLLMAKMDARLIIQVLINLVDNALKYTPSGSPISVSARQEGKWVVIQIADEGPGIPEKHKSHIFEMFYTIGNRNGDNRRSLGLGLALCQSIINAHGGTINIRDNIPHGTIFTFTLPAEEGTIL